MGHFQTVAGLVALVGLSTSAAAAPNACMTEPEVIALVGYMAPAVLRTATKTCGSTLGPNTYLATSGGALIATYQANAERTWPAARTAMLKLAGEDQKDAAELLANLSDNALRELMNQGLVQAVAKDIKVKDCAKIDRVVRSLAPVAPETVTQLVAGLMTLVKEESFPVCEAS